MAKIHWRNAAMLSIGLALLVAGVCYVAYVGMNIATSNDHEKAVAATRGINKYLPTNENCLGAFARYEVSRKMFVVHVHNAAKSCASTETVAAINGLARDHFDGASSKTVSIHFKHAYEARTGADQ